MLWSSFFGHWDIGIYKFMVLLGAAVRIGWASSIPVSHAAERCCKNPRCSRRCRPALLYGWRSRAAKPAPSSSSERSVPSRILTQQDLSTAAHYGYLGLYILGYLADDSLIIGSAVLALSLCRLDEQGGRWLKLVSGLIMLGLGGVMLLARSGYFERSDYNSVN